MKILNQFRKMSAPTIIQQQQNKPNQIQLPIQSQMYSNRKLRNKIRWYKIIMIMMIIIIVILLLIITI